MFADACLWLQCTPGPSAQSRLSNLPCLSALTKCSNRCRRDTCPTTGSHSKSVVPRLRGGLLLSPGRTPCLHSASSPPRVHDTTTSSRLTRHHRHRRRRRGLSPSRTPHFGFLVHLFIATTPQWPTSPSQGCCSQPLALGKQWPLYPTPGGSVLTRLRFLLAVSPSPHVDPAWGESPRC